VHVESTSAAAEEQARAASARELAHHIKSTVGVSARIDVQQPGNVARSEGKAKRVVDNRPRS